MKKKEKEFLGFITVRHNKTDHFTYHFKGVSKSKGFFFAELMNYVNGKFGNDHTIIAYGIEEL